MSSSVFDRQRESTRQRQGEAQARAIGPLLGVVLLVAITVVLASVVAVGATSFASETSASSVGVAISLAVDADQNELRFQHTAGEPIDVRELTLRVRVNGDHLTYEPPVPFVGAAGFVDTPEGPFNAEADPMWETGEYASFRLASTNDPQLTADDSVHVTVAVDGQTVIRLEETAT